MQPDYSHLTEVPGSKASEDQLRRMFTRYRFAAGHCREKDTLEVACGGGQGLALITKNARSVVAGDFTQDLLRRAKAHYGSTVKLCRLDAQILPFRDGMFDVIIFYEALYYLERPETFFEECRRVLRPGGKVLMSWPNRSLPDFHSSPLSYHYYTPPELRHLMSREGFQLDFYGDAPMDNPSMLYRSLSLLKRFIVKFRLMPGTLKGREFLKRIVYGRLWAIPNELTEDLFDYIPPQPLSTDVPDYRFRVLYAVARIDKA